MTFQARRETVTDLYTLEEVAARTGFALRTLQRDARAEKFAHVRRGKTRLMTEDQIEDLIKSSTVGGAPRESVINEASKVEALRRTLVRSKS